MADYQLTPTGSVLRREDGMVLQAGHPEYADYTAWVSAGNVADPAEPLPIPLPPLVDANARLDAGVMAALTAAEDVRDSVHAIPGNFTAANFQAFLLQAKILSDAFVAMLQAQAAPTQPPPP